MRKFTKPVLFWKKQQPQGIIYWAFIYYFYNSLWSLLIFGVNLKKNFYKRTFSNYINIDFNGRERFYVFLQEKNHIIIITFHVYIIHIWLFFHVIRSVGKRIVKIFLYICMKNLKWIVYTENIIGIFEGNNNVYYFYCMYEIECVVVYKMCM